MKKEIKIPDIAENVDSGIIGNILVSKGDEVKKDQPLVEVETDKAATDIPSPFSGTIEEIKVEEGDEVSVNQVIMIIEVMDDSSVDDDSGEEPEEKEEKEGKEAPQEKEAPKEKEAPQEKDKKTDEAKKTSGDGQDSDEGDDEEDEDVQEEDDGADEPEDDVKENISQEEADAGESSDRKNEKEDRDAEEKTTSGKKRAAEDIAAAPSLRRMARESGIDLSEIEGTGPGKRITAEDIASARKGKDDQSADGKKKEEKKDAGSQDKEATMKREGAIELPDFSQWGDTKKEKMNTVRRITARTMTASWQQIPQVTQFDEADITDIEAFRQRNKDDYDKRGGKLTVTAILLKISAFALQKFPRFNSSLDTSDNSLVMKQYINIGIAVDTDKGLIVPVIRDTDKKSLEKISVETVELAKKARESEISLDDLQGGNFTISNLGGIGGTGFTPIVYAPQVAILGVSRASYKQVFREDRFQQRLILPLSLTYDHRVIDGADGARFLRWICEVLEDPYALLQ